MENIQLLLVENNHITYLKAKVTKGCCENILSSIKNHSSVGLFLEQTKEIFFDSNIEEFTVEKIHESSHVEEFNKENVRIKKNYSTSVFNFSKRLIL